MCMWSTSPYNTHKTYFTITVTLLLLLHMTHVSPCMELNVAWKYQAQHQYVSLTIQYTFKYTVILEHNRQGTSLDGKSYT